MLGSGETARIKNIPLSSTTPGPDCFQREKVVFEGVATLWTLWFHPLVLSENRGAGGATCRTLTALARVLRWKTIYFQNITGPCP